MTVEGFRCAAEDECPKLRADGVVRDFRCPETSPLCEYVRCSIDPEDMPTFEEWAAQGGMGETYDDRPSSSPVAPASFNVPFKDEG